MARKVTSQIWIGNFDSEMRFSDYFSEADDYYSEENEDNDSYPLSRFIESQGEVWYDHDFFEPGYNDSQVNDMVERFRGHSWVEKWAPLVAEKIENLELDSINAFALMGVDVQKNGKPHYQIANPRSHKEEGIDLVYIGELTHEA